MKNAVILTSLLVIALINAGCSKKYQAFNIQSDDHEQLALEHYALNNGDQEAMIQLGKMHRIGYAEDRNLIDAYVWFTLANNPKSMELRNDLVGEMSEEMIEKAKIKADNLKILYKLKQK